MPFMCIPCLVLRVFYIPIVIYNILFVNKIGSNISDKIFTINWLFDYYYTILILYLLVYVYKQVTVKMVIRIIVYEKVVIL